MRICLSAMLIMTFLVAPGYLVAEEKPDAKIDFVPGVYKIKAIRDNFDGEEPSELVQEKCVPFERYQPFESNYMSDDCEVSEFKKDGSNVSYDIYCSTSLATGMKGSVSYGYEDQKLWWEASFVGNQEGRRYSSDVLRNADR